jgi:hypothetical protein
MTIQTLARSCTLRTGANAWSARASTRTVLPRSSFKGPPLRVRKLGSRDPGRIEITRHATGEHVFERVLEVASLWITSNDRISAQTGSNECGLTFGQAPKYTP